MEAATTPRRTNCCSLAAADNTKVCIEWVMTNSSRALLTTLRTFSCPETWTTTVDEGMPMAAAASAEYHLLTLPTLAIMP